MRIDIKRLNAEILKIKAMDEKWKNDPNQRLLDLLLDALRQAILNNNEASALLVKEKIKNLFPRNDKTAVYDTEFSAYWKRRDYEKAVAIHNKAGRLFWHSEEVGMYYEKKGFIEKAIREYEHLINGYNRINILPLPQGPVELYKLGNWYVDKDLKKAKKYLKLYLRAEDEWKIDPVFDLPYKEAAIKLLKQLENPIKK